MTRSAFKVLSDPKDKGQRIGYILYSYEGLYRVLKYFIQMFLHIFFIITPKGENFKLI